MLILWSTILASVGGFLLAAVVLIKAEKKKENFYFASMLIAIGLVSAANYFSNNSKSSPEQTLFWIRAVMFFVPLLIFALYEFATSFQNPDYKPKTKNFIYLSILTFLTMLLAVTPLTYSGVTIVDDKIIPKTGPGLALFGLYIIPFFTVSIINMLRNAKRTNDPKVKRNIHMTLALFLVSFGTQIITSFVLVAALNYTTLVPVGNFLMFIFAIVITVTIFDFNLLRINIIGPVAFVVALVLLAFADIVTARGLQNILYRSVVFVAVGFVGFELIKLADREKKQRLELQILAQQLKDANLKLKQVDAMKTEFISMASHELLTPISAIEGYLSMMLDEHMVKIEDPKARQYMESVYKSSKRLARLVADLLNVSRIEQGRLLVEKKVVDLKALINEVVGELKFKAEERKHRLLPHFRHSISAQTYGDEDKIKEVIINLAGNSIKYTHDGGLIGIGLDVWPTAEVEKRFSKMSGILKQHAKTTEGSLQNIVDARFAELIGDKQLVIIVKDTGIGITSEDIGHLFQKFSRVGDWSTQEVQGTGLGLYISRALVEMHHGRIWVESEGENKGSTFFFSLPTAQNEEEIKKLDNQVPIAKDAKPMAKAMNKE